MVHNAVNLQLICLSFSLKDYLEKNESTSESVVWEFLVDLTMVSKMNFK